MEQNKEDWIFCENIRLLRRWAHLSKKEMAKRLHIGLHTLTLLEHHRIPARLSCNIFASIHREFGILPKDLFRPLENMLKQKCVSQHTGDR